MSCDSARYVRGVTPSADINDSQHSRRKGSCHQINEVCRSSRQTFLRACRPRNKRCLVPIVGEINWRPWRTITNEPLKITYLYQRMSVTLQRVHAVEFRNTKFSSYMASCWWANEKIISLTKVSIQCNKNSKPEKHDRFPSVPRRKLRCPRCKELTGVESFSSSNRLKPRRINGSRLYAKTTDCIDHSSHTCTVSSSRSRSICRAANWVTTVLCPVHHDDDLTTRREQPRLRRQDVHLLYGRSIKRFLDLKRWCNNYNYLKLFCYFTAYAYRITIKS